MFCPKCGTKNADNCAFCINCKTALNEKNSTNIEQTTIISSNNNKNKKIIVIIIIILLIILLAIMGFNLLKNKNKDNTSKIPKKEEISYNYSDGKIPKFIDGTFSSNIVKSKDDVYEALENIKDKMKMKDVSKELKFVSEETSLDITYYKFEQVYEEVPVYKQNIIVSVDKNGKILGFSGYYIPDINISIKPQKTKEEIEKIVLNNLGENAKIMSSQLYVWANYKSQSLIYVVDGYSNTKAASFIVDANKGEIKQEISVFDDANTYSYTGLGLDNKTYTINLEEYFDALESDQNRYRFYDPIRKISIADYRFAGYVIGMLVSAIPGTTPITVDMENGKIRTATTDEVFIQSAITAMANYETIYDYYKNVLGRDSYDNKGSKIVINLGVKESTFSDKDLNNAMWCILTDQMYIGDWNGKSFSSSLDVLAHEFTHGVVSHTAAFAAVAKEEDKNKAFETGALNEGYADVLGNLIEAKNWTIAESNEILRDAANPNAYKNPGVKGEKYYYPDSFLKHGQTLEQFLKEKDYDFVTDYDKGGVHINSNVLSHAAYLMYEQGAFKSREEMAKVWYNSLLLLSSYSNFEDAALAVIKSAKNLGLGDFSIYKITKAFQDTKMLESNDFIVEGTITNDTKKLKNAKIEIYSYSDNSLITSTKSNDNGTYKLELPLGTYKVKVTYSGLQEYETILNLKGDTTLDIELTKTNINQNDNYNYCKTSDCVTLTFYVLAGNKDNHLEENKEVYKMDRGTVVDINTLLEHINKLFPASTMTCDGDTFHISLKGAEYMDMSFSWYYKDTDTKFDWSKPLMEDTEIEMKLSNGVDNDTLLQLDDLFNK